LSHRRLLLAAGIGILRKERSFCGSFDVNFGPSADISAPPIPLRVSNPAFRELASCFGPHLSTATLAFRELEIHRLARTLNRTRRKALKSMGQRQRGRPSRQPLVRSSIEALIAEGEILPLNGLKAFTLAVNKKAKFEPPISVDTVTRVLDQLHRETKDRRFQRLHRTRAR
jgi:hypothetical protein